ncbi:hypothetical protein [Flavobacterium lindanitolerans]|jgi:hypothetical protein|uniref:hypothetical protein n=1 Tax=Flavobacterium lindanitolerans TaxID=428988 RepID=UPI0023F4C5D2|nr:hypothetical protein [Flavobacterium lindanitolerans]
MKNTEKQILEIAKKVLQDLNGEYYDEKNLVKITFNKNDTVARPFGAIIDTWTVSIDALFNNRDFLTISDETGEPLYYQNFNTLIAEIEKNSDGKYVTKN